MVSVMKKERYVSLEEKYILLLPSICVTTDRELSRISGDCMWALSAPENKLCLYLSSFLQTLYL